MWALISACVLLVLLAVYCDAIDLVLDLVERNRSRLRTVDTPDGFDIALDHERTGRDSARVERVHARDTRVRTRTPLGY